MRGDEIRWVNGKVRKSGSEDLLLARVEFYPGRWNFTASRRTSTWPRPTSPCIARRANIAFNGRHIRKSVKGKPLELRLVVSELRDKP